MYVDMIYSPKKSNKKEEAKTVKNANFALKRCCIDNGNF